MFAVVLTTIATSFDLNAFVRRPAFSISEAGISLIFCSFSLASVWGLTRGLLSTLRYNREVYSKLEWDWAHSFMCRRCGKRQLIS